MSQKRWTACLAVIQAPGPCERLARLQAAVFFRPVWAILPHFKRERQMDSAESVGDHVPQISVIVPAWNEETRIERSLRSILAQTFTDFELIVVDDGSTDATAEVAQRVLAGRPSTSVLRKTNGGTGSALNRGFQTARGQYLTWWSADCWVEPDWLAVLHECLEAHPDIVMAYGDWMTFDEFTGTTETHQVPEYDKALLMKRCFVGPCWLFRSTAKAIAGDYLEEPCEDYDMHLKLSEVGPFQRVPKVLGTWRNHALNLTNRLLLNPTDSKWHGQARRIRFLHRRRLRKMKRGETPPPHDVT